MAIKKYVILIAGHSPGSDNGAQGQGKNEADETVQITNRVADLLLPHPNIFVDTVPHNLDYVDSTNWINARFPNLDDGINVEIHKNSTAGATGVETFTGLGADATTTQLAKNINDELARTSGLRNRGVKQAALYLITNSNQRAVLVEAGFMQVDPLDDAADARYAEGIANGICDFFGEARPAAVNVPAPVITPIPPTATPAQLYRLKHGDTQKGAYSSDKNAYSAWEFFGKIGVIELNGRDVTAEVVAKYTPKPALTPAPAPTVPSRDDLQDAEISSIKALLKTITDWLASFRK
jgi:N-acetylmuramoyl-L-alanine amidase